MTIDEHLSLPTTETFKLEGIIFYDVKKMEGCDYGAVVIPRGVLDPDIGFWQGYGALSKEQAAKRIIDRWTQWKKDYYLDRQAWCDPV